MILSYFRRRRALLAELETLRRENAQLRYDLATAVIAAWMRRQPEWRRPHPVDPARQRAAETEVHPRVRRTP